MFLQLTCLLKDNYTPMAAFIYWHSTTHLKYWPLYWMKVHEMGNTMKQQQQHYQQHRHYLQTIKYHWTWLRLLKRHEQENYIQYAQGTVQVTPSFQQQRWIVRSCRIIYYPGLLMGTSFLQGRKTSFCIFYVPGLAGHRLCRQAVFAVWSPHLRGGPWACACSK